MSFRHWALLFAFIVVAFEAVNSFWKASSSPNRFGGQAGAISGAEEPIDPSAAVAKLDGMWLPEDLKKQDDSVDYSFGRIITYSDGSDGPYSRTVWLQTWNARTDSVETYGADKTWWLGDPKTETVSIGGEKVDLESQVDPGSDTGQGPIRWFRMAWIEDGTGYRLLTRNISKDELLKIAESLPHP